MLAFGVTYVYSERDGEIRLKSRDSQKAHLRLLLNTHTKSQLLSSIWRADRGGAALFQGQKGGKSVYLPS